ncbi:hypothetical protein NLM33_41810 [Bradyrhizobium sp. CCGUVB1N3]|uniref:hypothetical protein n=1 Tax=Bradyrhizobium sp. CCGUVB1N3 TaxID=2949629 RepID=UPI0020B41B50|nr:hypothetical protein [Bradyrhizobium sp. CCGUVB1N3]MCP3476702.1 hypothetical protein [Bradyrhizobium sp. CCGUVB1N3]
MRRFALMASLLGIACLFTTAAYSQGAAVTLSKAASKNGRALFNIIAGGVVIGTCYEMECDAAVRKLVRPQEEAPSEADLKSSDDNDEVGEKAKETKPPRAQH